MEFWKTVILDTYMYVLKLHRMISRVKRWLLVALKYRETSPQERVYKLSTDQSCRLIVLFSLILKCISTVKEKRPKSWNFS